MKVVPLRVIELVAELPILVAAAPMVSESPMSTMVIAALPVRLSLVALIVKAPSELVPPTTPLRATAPVPDLIVRASADVPLIVEAKSTVPFAVVKIISVVANVAASSISIFPPAVVILPFKVIPAAPSRVTLPISVPIPATDTLPLPASKVTVVVEESAVPAIAPSIKIFPAVSLPVSTFKSETVARVMPPSSNLTWSSSVLNSGDAPVIA